MGPMSALTYFRKDCFSLPQQNHMAGMKRLVMYVNVKYGADVSKPRIFQWKFADATMTQILLVLHSCSHVVMSSKKPHAYKPRPVPSPYSIAHLDQQQGWKIQKKKKIRYMILSHTSSSGL